MAAKHIHYFIFLLLMLAALNSQAADARSPEALAMQFVVAYRAADAEAIVKLTYFNAQTALHREQMASEKVYWQDMLRRYRMTGFRVVNLSGADRQWLVKLNQNKNKRNFPLRPIKKMVVELAGRNDGEQVADVQFIGAKDGRYHFVVLETPQGN